jgi:hypothetical protein
MQHHIGGSLVMHCAELGGTLQCARGATSVRRSLDVRRCRHVYRLPRDNGHGETGHAENNEPMYTATVRLPGVYLPVIDDDSTNVMCHIFVYVRLPLPLPLCLVCSRIYGTPIGDRQLIRRVTQTSDQIRLQRVQ